MDLERSLIKIGGSGQRITHGATNIAEELNKNTFDPDSCIVAGPPKLVKNVFDVDDPWVSAQSERLIIPEELRQDAIIHTRQKISEYCESNIARGLQLGPEIYSKLARYIGLNTMIGIWPEGFNGEEAFLFRCDIHGFILITNRMNGICVYDNVINWYRYDMPLHVTLSEHIVIHGDMVTIHEIAARVPINVEMYDRVMTLWAVESINLSESSKFAEIIDNANIYIEHNLQFISKELKQYIEDASALLSIPVSTGLCSIRISIPSPVADPSKLNDSGRQAAKNMCWAREYGKVSSKPIIRQQLRYKARNGKTKQCDRSLADIVAIEHVAHGIMYGALLTNSFENISWDDFATFTAHKLPPNKKK